VTSYVRPAVAEQTYRDADGAVIEYGNRWGSEGLAADSYSVDSHPERFAPVHRIAHALVDTCSAHISGAGVDQNCEQDLQYPRHDYPGIIVHAALCTISSTRRVGATPAMRPGSPWLTNPNGRCTLSRLVDAARKFAAVCRNRGSGTS
jgi:hypothetical protein